MRVTGNTIPLSIVSQLNLLAARQGRLQNQVSTGQRIAAPEDDPRAMSGALGLQDQSNRLAQYLKNISVLQNRATAAQDAIQALKTVSDRAGEIATQADGTRSPEQLQVFAAELNQLLEQALQFANRKDGHQYLFAGTAGAQPPFSAVRDESGQITSVAYQGNTGTAQVEIAEGTAVSLDAPGQNASGSGARGVFADSREGADLFTHLIAMRDHLLEGNTDAIATRDRPALQQDEENIIFHAAHYGVLKARLDNAEVVVRTQDAGLQESITSLAGADLTESIMHLTQVQNAYQLAIQSSAKLLQLQQSLLSYLP